MASRRMLKAVHNNIGVVLLLITVTAHTTSAQQFPQPQLKGQSGRTPSPRVIGLKGYGGVNIPAQFQPANQNVAGHIQDLKGQALNKPVQGMNQGQGHQLYRRVGPPSYNAEQPKPINLNYNKPNIPVENTANRLHDTNNRHTNNQQISDNKNLLVNQNPIQDSFKRVIDKSANLNAFKVPVDRNVDKGRVFNERPVGIVQDNVQPVVNNKPVVNKDPGLPGLGPKDPVPMDLFDDKSNRNIGRGEVVTPKKVDIGDANKVDAVDINKVDTGDIGTNLGEVKPIKTKWTDEDEGEEEEDDEEVEDDEEEEGEDEDGEDNIGKTRNDFNNVIPREREDTNNEVINGNYDHRYPDNVNGIPNMENVLRTDSNRQGSMKVVWDWSDFAVNFEQYIMPEQKIRRAPHATTGEPWPLPQYYVSKADKVYRIDKDNFRFKLAKIKCDIIEKAIERYRLYVLEDAVEDMYDNFQHAQGTAFEDPAPKYDTELYLQAPSLSLAFIKIRKPCARYPTTKMDESYDVFVKRTGIHIMANEVWGALRGLETFSQLVFKGTNQELYIRDTVINDFPRFSHRGVMIDSSRHFMFKETIYDVLEGMAQNKMNVLHWHLVDDQSFPFYSSAFPDLSAKGAFHPTFVYMPEDIAAIIEFARLRGIRVEPEFDTPGHTYSWGLSRPDILTQCYQGERPVEGYLGPMDPSKNETFRFLKTFFKDVMSTFKDEFLHLGGDEVPMTCWQSNPEVMKFLAKLEGRKSDRPADDPYYYSYDIRKVLEYYVNRLIGDLKSLASKRPNGIRFVFWQEIMNNNVQLPNDTIIHVWQGGMDDVQRATSLGLNVIYSTCWYLDQVEYGTKWSKYYQCDPADMTYGYTIDESKVLGGETCLWAEYIENENAMVLLWPRASAAAERLWSHKDVKDLDTAATRLQEHRCRMLSRGLGVGQISGPDYCLKRGKRRWQLNETSTNCTQCGSYSENSRVEVEKIKVEFEQKGGHMSDCSQAVIQAGGQMTVVLLIIVVIAVAITLKVTKQKIQHVRLCRNKTILLVFVTLILVYFMCYTSIWMQAMQFKGSFEKRTSSNFPKGS